MRGPVVLGHEQVGRVVAMSPLRRPRDAHGHRLAVGDRVVWAAGVAGHRYGHDRVERGWELSGGCATHVQVLARTPIVRVGEDARRSRSRSASCGAFTAERASAPVDARRRGEQVDARSSRSPMPSRVRGARRRAAGQPAAVTRITFAHGSSNATVCPSSRASTP